MKRLKKMTALMLTLCLVLTGAVPAYAEEMMLPETAAEAVAAGAIAAEAVEAEPAEDEAADEDPTVSAEKTEQTASILGTDGVQPKIMYYDYVDGEMVEKTIPNDTVNEYTVINSSITEPEGGYTLESGKWYVVKENVTFSKRIENNAAKDNPAHLILVDGNKLTASKGIHNPDGKGLVIYGQSAGTGEINVPWVNKADAGIGGGSGESGGKIIINGGTVTPTGGEDGAGIGGGGRYGSGGEITINGGTVSVCGKMQGAAIGGGDHGNGGTIIINGGTVTATGVNNGAGIGGGQNGGGGTIIISGGTVTATGGSRSARDGAAGIGGGYEGNGANVILKGGKITATGGNGESGIGPGSTLYVSSDIQRGTLSFDRMPAAVQGDGITISAEELKTGVEKKGAKRYHTVHVEYTQASYKVEHKVQKELFGSEYELRETETRSGYLKNDTEAKPKNYDGYVTRSITNVPMKEDGSAVAVIYYDKYYATITFDMNGIGTAPQPIKNVPGASISAPEAPLAEGYIFGGWYTEKECTNSYEFSVMPQKDLTLFAKWATDPTKWKDVQYVDADGSTKTASCIVLSADSDYYTFEGRWYAVTGNVTIKNRIENQAAANDPAHLILVDGKTFTVSKGIHNPDGKGLIIYGQSAGTGELSVRADKFYAGIGGAKWESGGNVTINGGNVSVEGGQFAEGIGRGSDGKSSGDVIINRGNVTAAGGDFESGIGGHIFISDGMMTVSGGWPGCRGISGTIESDKNPAELKAGEDKGSAVDVDFETYKTNSDKYKYAYLRYAKADYQVKHLLQKEIRGEEYELKITETLSGFANNLTEAAAKVFDNYEPSFDQQKIKEDGSTVIEIKYDLVYRTISFDANGHGTAPDPIYAVPGAAISAPRDPFAEGYTFGGWFTDAKCTDQFTFSTMPSEDKTLFAKWTPIPYTITWKDGNTVLRTDKVDYDAMPDYGPDPSKTGYEFLLWWPTIQKVTGDATYNAIFYKPVVKHTVTWMLNDIKLIDITEVTEGEMPVHENPERDGYIFIGWKPALAPVTGNVKYTAYFEERVTDKVAVTFHTDGGTFINTQVIDRNTTPVRPADPLKAGCRFEGWYREPGFITPYNFDEPFNTDMTLYAKWEALPAVIYTVTWNMDDGTLIDITEEKEGNMPSHSNPSKEGYIFVSWEPSLAPVMGDITYTAKFEQRTPDKAAVTFNTVGGSFVETQVVPKGQKAARPSDPVKTGYEFVNWYADAGFAALYDFNTAVTADITLFAKWQKNAGREYTITFKDWDGNILATSKVAENGLPKYPGASKPSRSGYIFTGWTPEIDLAAADAIYTATYEPKSSGGGGGGGSSVPAAKKPVITFSPNWYSDIYGVWRIKNSKGEIVKNAWLCDDAVAANGQNVWYLLGSDGAMLAAGLVQDATGNFYSLETNHDGYFGMLRYTDGYYNCNGQQVYLKFSKNHDGTFGAVTNPDGIEKLKAIYGVTKYGIGNENAVHTKTF